MKQMSEPILERDPTDPRTKRMSPTLKFVLEMGPLLIFFFATFRGEWLASVFPILAGLGKPLFIATALFMVATVISLGVSWLLTRTIPLMPLVSGAVVIVFGALSIWLQNDTFIKMKPTIVYTLFAAVLLGGLAFGRPLLGYVFDSAFHLDAEGWRKLSFRWALFFVFSAVINEVVWRGLAAAYPAEQADEYWASFKLFGFTALTFLFILSQMPLIMRHSLDEQPRDK
jgi:intracellular septation protein